MRKVNRRVLESLIKCGAFDLINSNRALLFASVDSAMGFGIARRKERDAGQVSMFDMIDSSANADSYIERTVAETPLWTEHQILSFEKESLGFYLTGHPLAQFEELVGQYTSDNITVINTLRGNREVKFAAVVSTMREIMTRKGSQMAFVTFEDLTGTIEAIVFSDVYKNNSLLLKSDNPIFVIGTSEASEEGVKIIAKEIFPLSELPSRLTKSIHFYFSAVETDQKQISLLKTILAQYPGKCPGFVHISIPDKSETVMELPAGLNLAPNLDMVKTLTKVFGHNVTRFQS